MKENKGITLVALVITIIILIILAGISISIVLGEDGLIAKSKGGAENYQKAAEEEQNILDNINAFLEGRTDTVSSGTGGGISTPIPPAPTEIIYVTLYSDGTLVFSNNNSTDSNKTISNTYTIGKEDAYSNQDYVPWKNERSSISKVVFSNSVVPLYTKYWFVFCNNLSSIEHIENLKTNYTINMECMFAGCSGLTQVDVSSFDMKNVTSINGMFYNCTGLTRVDLSNWDTSNVIDMACLFDGGSSGTMILEEVNLAGKFNTENVTGTSWMFAQCGYLQHIYVGEHWDLSKVSDSEGMYHNCSSARPELVDSFSN